MEMKSPICTDDSEIEPARTGMFVSGSPAGRDTRNQKKKQAIEGFSHNLGMIGLPAFCNSPDGLGRTGECKPATA
ncbi:MAG: hypothetical protein L0Y36_02375 [Planctomycetales bacterium]|nr:hypothetical protein [Planctomycetales bacterium]